MRVLVACEFSGIVRDAFAKRGHEAWSCDLLPTDSYNPIVYASDLPECDCCGDAWCQTHEIHYSECPCIGPDEDGIAFGPNDTAARHLQGDVLSFLGDGWDLMIAHPPCTYLCSSGLHWNTRIPDRAKLTEEAVSFFMALCNAPIPKIAAENPIGRMSTAFRRPDQIIQPWQFGHPESKSTCLWLKGLPKLRPTNVLPVPSSGRWSNQTASGQNKLPPSPDRWKIRSLTYPGIAEAMADQWGGAEVAGQLDLAI